MWEGVTGHFRRRVREWGAGWWGLEQSQGNAKLQKQEMGQLVHMKLIWFVNRCLSKLDSYISSETGDRGLSFRC